MSTPRSSPPEHSDESNAIWMQHERYQMRPGSICVDYESNKSLVVRLSDTEILAYLKSVDGVMTDMGPGRPQFMQTKTRLVCHDILPKCSLRFDVDLSPEMQQAQKTVIRFEQVRCLTLTVSLSHSLSLSRFHCLIVSLTLSVSLSHSLSVSHCLTHSHCLIVSLTLTLTHSHTLLITCTCCCDET